MKQIFEWDRLLFNGLPPTFLLEVVVRALVMYIIILIALRASGKRGVKQLSVYELVLIIGLGSAAGDPMFYEDVGLIPAITVFMIIILLYRGTTWLSGKNKRLADFLEGKPVCLIENGKFSIENFKKENLAQDEFFSELRQQNVEHLGQVRIGIIEPTGELSLFFYEDKDVKPGLPLVPGVFQQKSRVISLPGVYACTFCGTVRTIGDRSAICSACRKDEWIPALKNRRIS
jgi:uncharacterized membrane protein YcaP (DUF421 family)